MVSGYPVPAGEAQVELRFKNSRFIGRAGPAPTVEEARRFVARLRAQFPEASHHAYAFAVGYGATVVHGMSDDGEPPGTAGRPMLAVVQGAGLGDVAVVVTRYFGGTKLGTGGLVKAYSAAAQAALEQVPRQEKVERVAARLELPYEFYARCRAAIEGCGGQVEAEDFGARVELRLRLRQDRLEELRRAVQELTAGQVAVELTG